MIAVVRVALVSAAAMISASSFIFASGKTVEATLPVPLDPVCKTWAPAVTAGWLETSHLPEASGLAVSRLSERLFHVNDSGDKGVFYVTKKDGTDTRKVKIESFKPTDTEEIALGPCGAKTCLFIGDIGDNRGKRKQIEFLWFEETATFPESLKPLGRIKVKYPDKARNAEAFAVHPSGDIFVFTKEMEKSVARPSRVFRLPKKDLEGRDGRIRVLEEWGILDVPSLVGATGYEGLVTGMSMAPSGARFLLLTYERTIEVAWDLAKTRLPSVSDLKTADAVSVIATRRLNQQEAIGYDVNGRDFLYDTESWKVLGLAAGKAELVTMKCMDPVAPRAIETTDATRMAK